MSDPSAAAAASPATQHVGDMVTHPEALAEPGKPDKPRSLASDAWHDLRRRPLFLIASAVILFLVVVAIFPEWFTTFDPSDKDLDRNRQGPSAEFLFGTDLQGQSVFARVIYGTRWTLLVGVLASLLTVLIGGIAGIVAGYFGGWVDSVLSRVGEVFFALPFVLGAIVIISAFRSGGVDSAPAIVGMVVLSIAALTWPIPMRIMRAATLSAKQQDYVKAARALGAGPGRIIFRHILPNSIAPVLVYATIALGAFIGAEATLSFLGVGLRDPAVSWGVMIADARDEVRISAHQMLFPAGILTVTVLAFVMLGDAVRDAFDPKLK